MSFFARNTLSISGCKVLSRVVRERDRQTETDRDRERVLTLSFFIASDKDHNSVKNLEKVSERDRQTDGRTDRQTVRQRERLTADTVTTDGR